MVYNLLFVEWYKTYKTTAVKEIAHALLSLTDFLLICKVYQAIRDDDEGRLGLDG